MSGRILLTGAGGFLGNAFVETAPQALRRETIAAYRSTPPDGTGTFLTTRLDITDRDTVDALFEEHRPETVIHCAALIHNGYDPAVLPQIATVNVNGTANVLAAAMNTGCQRFVFCSTTSVYGRIDAAEAAANPAGIPENFRTSADSYYAWSKLAGEQLLEQCGLAHPDRTFVSLRLDGIHGRGRQGGVVDIFTRRAAENQPIVVNEPDSVFKLLFIDDAVRALVCGATADIAPGHSRYNITSAGRFTLGQLAEEVIDRSNSDSPLTMGEGPSAVYSVLDTARAEAELSYEPQSWQTHLNAMNGGQ